MPNFTIRSWQLYPTKDIKSLRGKLIMLNYSIPTVRRDENHVTWHSTPEDIDSICRMLGYRWNPGSEQWEKETW